MNVAVILAGGTGTRLGGEIPKQYIQVDGKPVIAYCLDRFLDNDAVDAVQIVADAAWHKLIKKYIEESGFAQKWMGFSRPGETRQLSIFHGLEDIRTYADAESYVMIHDAARPLVKKDFLQECFQKVQGHDGIMPVLTMKDTVYLSEDGNRVTSLLDRERIFAGQAPEVFRLGVYFDANKVLIPDKILSIKGSTEPAVMAGLDIVMIAGDEGNFKITTGEDLERFKQKIKGK